jgi:hypothetical protein
MIIFVDTQISFLLRSKYKSGPKDEAPRRKSPTRHSRYGDGALRGIKAELRRSQTRRR